MSEGMAELAKKYVGNLSAKGVLYIEAVEMITKGHALISEGEKALQHLEGRKPKNSEGYGGTQGGLLTKARKDYTAREVAANLNCGYGRTLDALNEGEDFERVGVGNKVRWTISSRAHKLSRKPAVANKTTKRSAKAVRQASCKAQDPEQQKADEDKIVALLAKTPGLTKLALMTELKRSFYPIERAINSLIKAGRLVPQKVKIENGSTRQTWVPA